MKRKKENENEKGRMTGVIGGLLCYAMLDHGCRQGKLCLDGFCSPPRRAIFNLACIYLHFVLLTIPFHQPVCLSPAALVHGKYDP